MGNTSDFLLSFLEGIAPPIQEAMKARYKEASEERERKRKFADSINEVFFKSQLQTKRQKEVAKFKSELGPGTENIGKSILNVLAGIAPPKTVLTPEQQQGIQGIFGRPVAGGGFIGTQPGSTVSPEEGLIRGAGGNIVGEFPQGRPPQTFESTIPDILGTAFGITPGEARRKAILGSAKTPSYTERFDTDVSNAVAGGDVTWDELRLKYPTKIETIDKLELQHKPVSVSPGFKRGSGLAALLSPSKARITPSTERVIGNIRSEYDLREFIQSIEKYANAGVDTRAVLEYFGKEQ